jgi:hypothetical protein
MMASLLVGGVRITAAKHSTATAKATRRGDTTRLSRVSGARGASDIAAWFDLSAVLQWAGRPAMTDVLETRATEAPEYVLSAVTRAYRDQQRRRMPPGTPGANPRSKRRLRRCR